MVGKESSGSIVSIWRYPVKSMMGEQLNAVHVTQRGLLGDRAYALMDPATGAVASAKDARRFGKLFDCLATFVEPPRFGATLPMVRITLPNGEFVVSSEPNAVELLSRAFQLPVALAFSPPENPESENIAAPGLTSRESSLSGPFFDAAPVHLLTTTTLDRLQEEYPRGRFEVRRFRPNIVVEPTTGLRGFVENDWIGKSVRLGDAVKLKIIGPCPRCVMTTLRQGDLPRDPGILQTIAQHTPKLNTESGVSSANVGVYALVERSGSIERGDCVWVG